VAITFLISGYLTAYTGGRAQVELEAEPSTVRDALDSLWSLHLGLRDRVCNEQGQVRQHVNVFVGDENIRQLSGLDTPLIDGKEICILPSVSGGATATLGDT
jgi:molybdopterin synthase sulfur carrier subunit